MIITVDWSVRRDRTRN